MTAKEAVEDPSVAARYEELLATHLGFYEALRLRERRPRSAAQRQFQDVAWGEGRAGKRAREGLCLASSTASDRTVQYRYAIAAH